jgi:FKBP-type peptidyl-prolyl cis-trans isomerase FkpA
MNKFPRPALRLRIAFRQPISTAALLALLLAGTGPAISAAIAPAEAYMREARQRFAMQQTDSGLLYRLEAVGAGSRPRRDDTIVLSFSALAPDGKTELPQLSRQKLRTKVADLLPGLAEGVQMIALGSRILFIVPPKLSFANGEWPAGIEPGTPLIFRVELQDIIVGGSAP